MPTILLAEDDAPTRNAVRTLLEKQGHDVTAVGDGQEAMDQFEKNPCGLVITDIWMPGLTGLELLTALRSRPAPPKVVVMTADSTPETLLQAVKDQTYAYLVKPIDSEELLRVVEDALSVESDALAIEVVSAKPDWVELRVPCTRSSAERVRTFMLNLEADLDDATRDEVGSAFYELLSNAVEWGGALDPNAWVRIACLRFDRMLMYRIQDPGPGFRLDALKHAAIGHPDDPIAHVKVREEQGIRPGGFGIKMAQNLVDELLYNESQNEVVFIRYLD